MNVLVTWLVLAAAVWITGAVLPGVRVRGFVGALVTAAIFGLMNWAIGWLLFVLIGVGTLGLGFLLAFVTRWLVDAILLKLTAALTTRLEVRSFAWALVAALVMSGVGTALEYVVRPEAAVETTDTSAPAEVHL